MSEAAVATAVERIRAAPKYRAIHVETVADIVRQELAHATSDADLERRARLKLHKVIAGYLLTARPARVLRGLDDAVAAGPAAVRDWCRAVLGGHFSTAERLSDLDRLYPAILELTGDALTGDALTGAALTGAAGSIADLACALNPFATPWLREATAARYTGYDLNASYVELGTAFLARVDPAASVAHRDVLIRPEEIRADVALLLKTYHCIEDRRPGAAVRLVEQVGARHVVVSFPVRTMSGRLARFTGVHIERLTRLAGQRGWGVGRAALRTEELVVLAKGDGRGQHG
jgi:16S rRNA (guanine(1405)-N(7))-methyltransferase